MPLCTQTELAGRVLKVHVYACAFERKVQSKFVNA